MKKRAAKKTEFHEGSEAVQRFESMMEAVLTVPKDKILELEKQEVEKKNAAKKKRS
ncbi:MAG: hypothetical protein OJI67_13920 [Prosthecobacter sp.]|nr:hypothetical protein [Prosthecobacter sp.]